MMELDTFHILAYAAGVIAGLLVCAFAFFEWAVRTGRLAPARAGLVFPGVSLLGGALPSFGFGTDVATAFTLDVNTTMRAL